MSLFFTNNKINSLVSDISAEEKISAVAVSAWAGRASERFAFFRIGNDSAVDRTLLIQSNNPDVEISTDKRTWSPALNYDVDANKVGDGLFVRCLASPDIEEGDRIGAIHADEITLTVNYFLAQVNEGDTENSQARRFTGDNTLEVATFFDNDGSTIRIIEYDPMPVPLSLTNPFSFGEIKNARIDEWVNPYNQVVGYKAQYYYSKAFIGDRDSLINKLYNPKELALSFGDTNSILLPHDFAGFNPSWQKHLEPIGEITPGTMGYKGTVWTILRDNFEYGLCNIRRVGFFRDQILFWLADLQRINYSGGSSTESFLPWNEIKDFDWKTIDYVPSFSLDPQQDEYCPYSGYF